MKSRVLFFSTLLFCSLFLFNSCGEKKAEWQATVEEVDGVRVVTNPIEPYYGEVSFELEEDLSIGNEDDENYLFFEVFDLAVDQDGNIYVSESGNVRVQKFDRDGNYLLTIGREGQGPREYEQPTHIFYDESKGNICIHDRREIVIFDRNGDYVNAVSFINYPSNFMFDASGNIWGRFSKIGEGLSFTVSMANLQGELIKDVAEYPKLTSSFSRGESYMTFGHGYEYELLFSGIDSQTFVYGYSKEYKLNVVSNDGELQHILLKDEPQIPFTGSMESNILERYTRFSDSEKDAIKFPESFPYFKSILADDLGRIYVERMKSPSVEEDFVECDIFSNEGYYLYKTHFPKLPRIMKNGYCYVIDVDEETGLETVKRYRINNWSQIKAEFN